MIDIAIGSFILFCLWGVIGFFANGGKVWIENGYLNYKCDFAGDLILLVVSGPIIWFYFWKKNAS